MLSQESKNEVGYKKWRGVDLVICELFGKTDMYDNKFRVLDWLGRRVLRLGADGPGQRIPDSPIMFYTDVSPTN
jgi:hypothetical protein